LCSEQYSLRTALDHVPPMLEILGTPAVGEMGAFGEAHGEIHAESHGEAASLAEHAAGLAPDLGAEHFPQPDLGSNGEQTIEFEHAAPGENPPALDKVGGLQQGGLQHEGTEHLGEFDLELDEHAGQPLHAEHFEQGGIGEPADPAAAALGEYQGDHRIEPGSGEHAGEGDPEFQFAGDGSGEGMEEDTGEERHSMGGIATLVQTAPPAKKRRQAPLAVKLVGILLFFGFGFLGCYFVYGAFLWMHSDQFHLKQYFPAFLRNRVADEPVPPPRKTGTEKLTPGSNPAGTPTTGTVDSNPATTPPGQVTSQDDPSKTSPTGDNPTAIAAPKKPGSNDLAQQSPDKSNTPLETTDDPLKTPPPDLDKGDPTKPDASGIAPPKFDTSVPPLGDVKTPVAPKTSVDPTDKPTPAPEKTVVDKPVVDKPVTDKPLDKPADNPTVPADAKSPIAAQLDNVDAAVAATMETEDNLKSASAPGAEPLALRRARIAQYKAMSHLVTELGAVDPAAADPDSKARIEQLDKKAAALAESMGSAAARDTTAMLAGKWIASPSRKESKENGAVVVGTLVKVEPTEKGFVAHIKMPSDSSEMVFITTKKPDAADGSPVVVLGLLNADGGGTAIEIVTPNDEKTPVAPPVDPTPKPADSDKPPADAPPTPDKPSAPEKPVTDKPANDKPAADKPAVTPDAPKPQ